MIRKVLQNFSKILSMIIIKLPFLVMKSNCKKLSFTGFWLDLIHFIQYLVLTPVILSWKPDMKNHNLINAQCTIVQEEDMYVVVSINLIGLSSF